MIKKIIILLFVTCTILFSACLKKEEKYCNPPQVSVPEEELTTLGNYIIEKKIDAEIHHAGFYYHISAMGDGREATHCSNIKVNYSGLLSDGESFDSGYDISFNMQDLIPGWSYGIPLIKERGIITIYLPPSLGYGNIGIPNKIPANAITVFKIELLEVE